MPSPQHLLKAADIRPNKLLGQNFLVDESLSARIVASARIEPDDTVLEVGPGLGALTFHAATAAKTLIAVEKDTRMAQILRPRLIARGIENARIIEADILRFDFQQAFRDSERRIVVIGNLPYNISSQLLVRLIENRDLIGRAVLMFQKELARRVCAGPGGKDYGRLSVMLAWCSTARKVLDARASCFYPRPKVDSEVLRIDFNRPQGPVGGPEERALFLVVRAAFGQRRKTLKNALTKGPHPYDPEAVDAALEQARVDPMRRAETLTPDEFVALSKALPPPDGPES